MEIYKAEVMDERFLPKLALHDSFALLFYMA